MFLPGGDMTLSKMSRLDIHPWSLMEIGFIAFGEQPENYWKTGALFAGVYGGRHILRSAGLIKGPVKRKFRPGNRKLLKKSELSQTFFDVDDTLLHDRSISKGTSVETSMFKRLKKLKPEKLNLFSQGGNYVPYFATYMPNVEITKITHDLEGLEITNLGKLGETIPTARQPDKYWLGKEGSLQGKNLSYLDDWKKLRSDPSRTIMAGSKEVDTTFAPLEEHYMGKPGKGGKNIAQFSASKNMPESFRSGYLIDDLAKDFSERYSNYNKSEKYLLPEEFELLMKNKKVIKKEGGIFIKSGEMILERGERLFKAITRAKPLSRAASLLIAGSILAEVSKPAILSGVKQLQNAVNTTMQHTHLDFGGTQMNIPMEAYNERNEALQRIQDARMQANYLFGNESQRYHS
jgi:hypothetical protein